LIIVRYAKARSFSIHIFLGGQALIDCVKEPVEFLRLIIQLSTHEKDAHVINSYGSGALWDCVLNLALGLNLHHDVI